MIRRMLVMILGLMFLLLGLGVIADVDFKIAESLGGKYYITWKQNLDGDRTIEDNDEDL